MILVVVLRKIEQNGRCLEYIKISTGAIDEDGDSTVGIQLDEPRFLYIKTGSASRM